MPGRYCTLVIALVSRYGLALLIVLGFPGEARPASAAGPEAALYLEYLPSPARSAFGQGKVPEVSLPFLHKKTYHIDALSLAASTDQRPVAAFGCAGAACAGQAPPALDYTIALYDARGQRPDTAADAAGSPSITSERFAALLEKSAYVGTVDVGIIMIMKQLPTSFTKWTSDRLTEATPLRQWQKHVTTAPVVDKDMPTVNVSHAYSGSGYYTLCRNTPGFTGRETRHMLECLLYGTVMSTFWEYGPEAFLEVPSIQDLLVTPLGGAILGELFHRLQRQIVANGGTIFGSPLLGRIVIVLLNPLQEVVQGMRAIAGPVVEQFDLRLHLAYGNLTPTLLQSAHEPTRADTTMMLQVTGRWPVKRAAYRK